LARKALVDKFTPKMYSGEWGGGGREQCLTEPNAEVRFSDLSTSAQPTDQEGVYLIKARKIYISCGDHDAVD